MLRVRQVIRSIHSVVAFESWGMYPAFNTRQGLGRAALIAFALGALLGMHVTLLIVVIMMRVDNTPAAGSKMLENSRIIFLIQWCSYVSSVCIFHLAEFFATALCNPAVLSTDSFIVNHSYAYTAAALVSSKGM